jgi:hypothetical protein
VVTVYEPHPAIELFAALSDEQAWEYIPWAIPMASDDLNESIRSKLHDGNRVTFTIGPADEIVGMTSFIFDPGAEDRRNRVRKCVECVGTTIVPDLGGHVARESAHEDRYGASGHREAHHDDRDGNHPNQRTQREGDRCEHRRNQYPTSRAARAIQCDARTGVGEPERDGCR